MNLENKLPFKHGGFSYGEMILEESPVLTSIRTDRSKVCYSCLTHSREFGEPYEKCIKCKTVFCRLDCYVRDNDSHKEECKHIPADLAEKPWENYYKFFLIGQLKERLDSIKSKTEKFMGHEITFDSLETKLSPSQFTDICGNHLANLNVDPIDACKYHSNVIHFYDLHGLYSCGLYLKASIFPHSCTPNAQFLKIGNKIQIRAIEEIEENTPITISKFNIFYSKDQRKENVKSQTGVECQCFPLCCELRVNDQLTIDYFRTYIQNSRLREQAIDNLIILLTERANLNEKDEFFAHHFDSYFLHALDNFDIYTHQRPHPYKIILIYETVTKLIDRSVENYENDIARLFQLISFFFPRNHPWFQKYETLEHKSLVKRSSFTWNPEEFQIRMLPDPEEERRIPKPLYRSPTFGLNQGFGGLSSEGSSLRRSSSRESTPRASTFMGAIPRTSSSRESTPGSSSSRESTPRRSSSIGSKRSLSNLRRL